MSKRILVVGLACADIISVVQDYPEEDSDQRVLDYYWQRGGNAANTSCVLSLLGARSEFLGTFATDREAEFLKEVFQKFNVITENCVTCTDGVKTPTSIVITNSKNGSRTILHHGKNWPEIKPEHFKNLDLTQYKWIHFEGRPSCDDIKDMLSWIDEYNKTVDKDARIRTSLEIEKTTRIGLDNLFNTADTLFVSKDYVKSRGYNTKEEGVQKLSVKCREGSEIICPWGEEGAVAKGTDRLLHSSPAFPPKLTPGQNMETLAAGDTFNAAFILSRSKGQSLNEALTFGCQVAGAKCGMKGIDGLDTFKS
ncbi:ketohexokinase-like [Mytilus californianus]|uniref:ketohexokinase-like n=1 Tax=Mytilus californianus TaxID=6549 RepID=UPI0022472840|nr:ketohexokinase-like [Mytilus californianus]